MNSDDNSQNAIDQWANDIHQGDAVEVLRELPESSVHMAMCSPPYYGLRDYGVDGQIGLEESLDGYIDSLLEVAAELRRVLRDDGSWWLNLGDSFAGSWGAQSKDETSNNLPQHGFPDKNPGRSASLRRKSKMLVPHRVAIALQDQGWVVRSDAVWAKPNPMPHPVKDRLHEHKEFLFHFGPEPDYWWDLDNIREPHKKSSLERRERYDFNTSGTRAEAYPTNENGEYIGTEPGDALHPNGKNPGDIIEVPVKPFPDAHFAVYPEDLCEIPIKSSCPPKVCADCGQPYERTVEETPLWERDAGDVDRRQAKKALRRFEESDLTVEHLEACRAVGFGDGDHGDASQNSWDRVNDRQQRLAAKAKDILGGYFREFVAAPDRTDTGWEQLCGCSTGETQPGIVLDPFAGSGTTCLVAKEFGRQFIGIDLNPEYVAMAQARVGVDVDDPELLDDVLEDQTTLGGVADGA